MSSRHKMLEITYDWENEKPKVIDSSQFKNYTRIEKLDSLSDVIHLLEKKYDKLIMGLPHAKRIVINDFAASNIYPSCSAINLHRDTEKLREFIR